MKTTPPGAGMQAEAAARFSRLNKKAPAELAEQERKYKENSQTLARSQAASHKAAQDEVTLPAPPPLEASTVEETPAPAEEQPRPPRKRSSGSTGKFLYEIDRPSLGSSSTKPMPAGFMPIRPRPRSSRETTAQSR